MTKPKTLTMQVGELQHALAILQDEINNERTKRRLAVEREGAAKKEAEKVRMDFADLKMRLVASEKTNEYMRGYLARALGYPVPGDVREGSYRCGLCDARNAADSDLLEALKGVVAVSDRKTVEYDRAHAAIAKAEGA